MIDQLGKIYYVIVYMKMINNLYLEYNKCMYIKRY